MRVIADWRDALTALNARYPHPAWGPAHCTRVYALALDLAAREGWCVDDDALFAASCLHDLGAFSPHRLAGADHAQRAAELAPAWLADAGYPGDPAVVQAIIRGHMYSADPGSAPEAIVFHDADTLDFMGAIGAARVLAIVGLDDWAPDLPSGLALLQRFARELPDALVSNAARTLGFIRSAQTKLFLDALADSTRGLAVL